MINQHDIKSAVQLIMSGATHGMVDNHLRLQGLREHLRTEVLEIALRIATRRHRIKAGLITLGGMGGMAACAYGFFGITNQLQFLMKPLGFLTMVFLLVTFYGLSGFVQRPFSAANRACDPRVK